MSPILTATFRATASLWLAGATVAIADPALAARSTGLRAQEIVATADLDLRSPTGRATAERRLQTAVRSVCDSGDVLADRACRDRAMTQGRRLLDTWAADRVAAR